MDFIAAFLGESLLAVVAQVIIRRLNISGKVARTYF